MVSEKRKNYFQDGEGNLTENGKSSFPSYLKALAQTMFNSEENYLQQRNDASRTVYISTVGVDTLAFDLREEDKDRLIASGRQGVQDFYTPKEESREEIVTSATKTLTPN